MIKKIYCYNVEFKNSNGTNDETQIDFENPTPDVIDIINTILSISKEMDIVEITDLYCEEIEEYEDYSDYEYDDENLPF